MLDLIDIFNSLAISDGQTKQNIQFTTYPIPMYAQHRLGKDSEGNPLILISINEKVGNNRLAPIVLEHIKVQYDIPCRVMQTDNTVEEGIFTIFCCTDFDNALHTYFLRIAGAIIAVLGPTPSRLQVYQTVNKVVELFRAMRELPKKSIQGLWAELFLIAKSRSPSLLVNAWHTTPEDRYDFNEGDKRIEVKSSSNRVRQHHFSLEQLNPPENTQLIIASTFVERAGAGKSILDLADLIRNRLTNKPELLLHLDKIITQTLGNNWRKMSEERFDYELAETSLAFFDVATIPTISTIVPVGVSEIRFKSDLSAIATLDKAYYRSLNGIFQAILRR